MDRQYNFPLQRVVGAFFIVGGLWHAAAPWVQRYSGIEAAVISSVASGLALAAVGVCYVIFRGGVVLNCLAAALGVWFLVAPAILGVHNWMMMNEAYWGGPLTLALTIIAAYDLHFHRPIETYERRASTA